jgi:hypothetical protein
MCSAHFSWVPTASFYPNLGCPCISQGLGSIPDVLLAALRGLQLDSLGCRDRRWWILDYVRMNLLSQAAPLVCTPLSAAPLLTLGVQDCSIRTFLVLCLVCLSFTVINTTVKTNLGEERVYFILESQVSSSLGKVRAGTKVETMKAEAHRLMCSLTCSVAQAQLVFLQPRAICVRDGAALSGLGPPISVKTVFHRRDQRLIRLKQFSKEVSLSKRTLGCVTLRIKLTIKSR